jgi:predicted alpha/beta-hydrolase family hydrolase
MNIPGYKFYFNPKAENLDVILQGSSVGMDSQFITKIWDASIKAGNSSVAFNFPYFERGETNSSGEKLIEETEALKNILIVCKSENYKTIRLIGKSLGGIVASFFLKELPQAEQSKYSVVIFGYVLGATDLKKFPSKIDIVQGSKDKFGTMEKVKEDMENALSKNIAYYLVEGGDHGYKNPETNEPEFEDKAIEFVFPASEFIAVGLE